MMDVEFKDKNSDCCKDDLLDVERYSGDLRRRKIDGSYRE